MSGTQELLDRLALLFRRASVRPVTLIVRGFRLRIANEEQLIAEVEFAFRIRVHQHLAVSRFHSDHVAVGVLSNTAVDERLARQFRTGIGSEDVQSLVEHEHTPRLKQIDDARGHQRRQRKHEVGASSMEHVHVSVKVGTADDLHIRTQTMVR